MLILKTMHLLNFLQVFNQFPGPWGYLVQAKKEERKLSTAEHYLLRRRAQVFNLWFLLESIAILDITSELYGLIVDFKAM